MHSANSTSRGITKEEGDRRKVRSPSTRYALNLVRVSRTLCRADLWARSAARDPQIERAKRTIARYANAPDRQSFSRRGEGRKALYDLTTISFSIEVAPGADQAVEPAIFRAFQDETSPDSVISPPWTLTLIVFGS